MKFIIILYLIFLIVYILFNVYIIGRVWKLKMAKDITPIAIIIYLIVVVTIILSSLFWMSIL